VPKRTGRKRKRGSAGPFLSEDEIASGGNGVANNSTTSSKTYVDASTVYRTLQDNASTYKVALAGVVDETHRFRSKSCSLCCSLSVTDFLDMPDLQYTAVHNDTMVGLRDHILTKRCKIT
jgi:general transcription factor 3C polypeptide 5 (transcription factor C subunit 1)